MTPYLFSRQSHYTPRQSVGAFDLNHKKMANFPNSSFDAKIVCVAVGASNAIDGGARTAIKSLHRESLYGLRCSTSRCRRILNVKGGRL